VCVCVCVHPLSSVELCDVPLCTNTACAHTPNQPDARSQEETSEGETESRFLAFDR